MSEKKLSEIGEVKFSSEEIVNRPTPREDILRFLKSNFVCSRCEAESSEEELIKHLITGTRICVECYEEVKVVHLADAVRLGVPRAALQKLQCSKDREFYFEKDVEYLKAVDFDPEASIGGGDYGDKNFRERWLQAELKRNGLKLEKHSSLSHAFIHKGPSCGKTLRDVVVSSRREATSLAERSKAN